MQLQARVTELERRVHEQREMIEDLMKVISQPPPSEQSAGSSSTVTVDVAKPAASNYGPRQMCPKCHVKPNYFLHVKYCTGNGRA